MTEWKSLLESDRIVLWRNTIQLFYRSKRSNFMGPFRVLEFDYKIEPLFLSRKEAQELKPDIVASGGNGWLVLELTTQPNSKKPKLDSYKEIDPRDLSNYGLPVHNSSPDIIISRLEYVDDGPYCQINVKETLDLKNEEYIGNQSLKDELIKVRGIDLRKLPDIPITLLPEMKSQEIRQGLVNIVMQLFDPNCRGKTVVQMVDEGLERLSDKIGPSVRSQLIDKVKNEMNILIQKYLNEYLELEGEVYKSTEKFKQHHKTMENVSSKLKEWAGPPVQKTLNQLRS